MKKFYKDIETLHQWLVLLKSFLAHLIQRIMWHIVITLHLSSLSVVIVVCKLLLFNLFLWITKPIWTKLGMNVHWMVIYKVFMGIKFYPCLYICMSPIKFYPCLYICMSPIWFLLNNFKFPVSKSFEIDTQCQGP